MRITKRQLKRLVKEERAKLIKEQSSVASEGALLAGLSMITDKIDTISGELHGLVDPVDYDRTKTMSRMTRAAEPQAGFEWATALEEQVEELNAFFDKLEAYFESMDDLAGRNPGGSIG